MRFFVILIIISTNLFGQIPQLKMIDFSSLDNLNNWQIVNDGVMGGISKSSLIINNEGHAHFFGAISLDFNGGFASFRSFNQTFDVENISAILIHLKGDKKKYQARIKQNISDYFSFVKTFETSGEWEVIKLSLNDFVPSFRGMTLDKSNFNGKYIEQIGILIGNKKNEEFKLYIDKITFE